MFYLALQTAALIAGTYFIGTFIGCLLHKFFNMLFGSKNKRVVAGAAGASSDDLNLFTKDGKKIDPAHPSLAEHDEYHVPGQKIETSGQIATAKIETPALRAETTSKSLKDNSDQLIGSAQNDTIATKTIETPTVTTPTSTVDDSISKVAQATTNETIAKAGAGIAAATTATAALTKDSKNTKEQAYQKTRTSNAIPTEKERPGFFSRWFGKSSKTEQTSKTRTERADRTPREERASRKARAPREERAPRTAEKLAVEIPKGNPLEKTASIQKTDISNKAIPTTIVEDTVSKIATSETTVKTGAAIATAATVATALTKDGGQTNKPVSRKTIKDTGAIPTDKVRPGFFSRWFGKNAKTIETTSKKANQASLTPTTSAKKPVAKLPKVKTVEKTASVQKGDQVSESAKIVIPAAVAGTAAAAATMAKSDNVIKTVSKMSSEVITITDPKPATKKVTEVVEPKAIAEVPAVPVVATKAANKVAEVADGSKSEIPKAAGTPTISKAIETSSAIDIKDMVETTKTTTKEVITSPLDTDLTKLDKADLIETTKALKAMALKDDKA